MLGKFTWRMLATVLAGEGICVLLGATLARSVAAANDSSTTGLQLTGGIVLGLLCFVAAGGMRRCWGLPLGWVVQVLVLLSALVVPMMLGVALIFGAMWIVCLRKGRQIDVEQARRASLG